MSDSQLFTPNSLLEGWICVAKTGWNFNFSKLPKNKELIGNARELRKAGVLSEVLFWQAFKNKTLLGFDIDRQVIIDNYIVDFFIPELGLIFEIDGQSHDFKGEYDLEREEYLLGLGLEVIHFEDIEIKKAMDSVAERVVFAVKRRFEQIQLAGSSTPSANAATPQEGNYIKKLNPKK